MLTSSSYAAAAANGANTGAGVAAAGKRIRVHTLIFSGSVAGRYQVFDNSAPQVLLYDGKLGANAPLVITYSNGSLNDGYVTNDANVSILLVNQTGVASDIAITANYDYVSNNTA